MSRDTQKPTGWQLPQPQEQATLTDLMAMAAMQGLLACPDEGVLIDYVAMADKCYQMADAMMLVRAKRMGVSHV